MVYSRTIHETGKRKTQNGETYLDFVLHVRMRAKRACLTKEIIQYVVNGITNDNDTNKAVLYGSKTIEDL